VVYIDFYGILDENELKNGLLNQTLPTNFLSHQSGGWILNNNIANNL